MVNKPEQSDLGKIPELISELRELIRSARQAAARSVNTIQVLTNFEIGRRIVEYEQQGKARAEYGKGLLKRLSSELTAEFGRGFSEDNLSLMRRFYLVYKDCGEISETVSGKFLSSGHIHDGDLLKSETLSRKFGHAEGKMFFPLSWSHYVFVISIDNPDERSFYEIEAAGQG